jgi:hypothetical protein
MKTGADGGERSARVCHLHLRIGTLFAPSPLKGIQRAADCGRSVEPSGVAQCLGATSAEPQAPGSDLAPTP